ncbi:hypothetical protein ACFQ4X_12040 [Fictibacillus halophilus]|uniref:hypothetical protein n=1 Tax=Fictibacillus halophilus TaxID=1610490 RepID=UPI0036286D86
MLHKFNVFLKEATASGLSQAIFGKAALLPFPWTHVDPVFYALLLSTVVFIAGTLMDKTANLNKQREKTEIIPAV